MGKITWNSEFKDVQELLVNEDETFIEQIKYLNSDRFKYQETDKGYLRRNFHFFRAFNRLQAENTLKIFFIYCIQILHQ